MADQESPIRGSALRSSSTAKEDESHDAHLEFSTTSDQMAAFISSYTPARGNGAPLSLELMEKGLELAGYKGQLDPDGAKFALQRASEGKSILNVALVRGTYPQEPENGTISGDADFQFPVLPDMVFGTLLPPVKASNGANLLGEVIPTEKTDTPEGLAVAVDGGCSYDKESNALISDTYGLVQIKENQIYVAPLIHVSKNSMQVRATLFPHDCFGSNITLQKIEPALQALGISRPILLVAGETALRTARETGIAKETVIAKGTEPIAGKNGWFEYAKEETKSIGTSLENDRIDFKERGTHPMVNPGEIIGKIHPPEEGIAGEDVYGRQTPPPGGQSLEIKPGLHVAPMPDGITYKALATGMVTLEKGELSVIDVLETEGDVDYSTGNIRLEKGSAHITGSIRQGFVVNVPGHILVKDSIEGAEVSAGGDIEISGGIIMAGKGHLKAGNNITAQFAANSRIDCGDSLTIAHELSNCLVRCKGTITATTGKGVIQGGSIASATGIEANELGSEIGVSTVLSIISRAPSNQVLVKERENLRERLMKINAVLGQDSDEDILARTPPDKMQQIEKILILRAQIKRKLKAVRSKLSNDLADYYESLERLSIRVKRTVYPGVQIKIGDKSLTVTKPLNRVKFHFDSASRTIVADNL
ncbi:FapA family protein [Desulfovibrio sp. UCD-KL4C]|uniref:FapA family protein n=1 Tax=Desulfovibrio sp. UCD-KL4C TaxID=2578120 RepID=UPI0025C717E9|nr:FapA family protein [Desulfovibrio sp. UCD-KL4C]